MAAGPVEAGEPRGDGRDGLAVEGVLLAEGGAGVVAGEVEGDAVEVALGTPVQLGEEGGAGGVAGGCGRRRRLCRLRR